MSAIFCTASSGVSLSFNVFSISVCTVWRASGNTERSAPAYSPLVSFNWSIAVWNCGYCSMFWQRYFLLEKGVYEKLLTNPDEKVEGTVKELADKYGLSIMDMTGFLDGINESLVEPNPIDTMEEDTKVSLVFDKEKLYKNMVDAKADWLYELPMWNDIFDPETKKRLYLEQKKSGTVIVGKKVGRNDPCPCGSGKKYKFCCGK